MVWLHVYLIYLKLLNYLKSTSTEFFGMGFAILKS